MNWFLVIAYTYLSVLCLAALAGLFHWKRLDITLKLITMLLAASAVTELLSITFKQLPFETEVHHHVLSLIQIFITICCYMSLRQLLNWKNAGIVFISAFALVSISAKYIQPIENMNSWVLVFQGVLFTFLAVHALFLLMISEEIRILKDPQFWFWTLALISGTVSVLYWGLYLVTTDKYQDVYAKMEIGHAVINLVLYAPLAYTLILTPKRRLRL